MIWRGKRWDEFDQETRKLPSMRFEGFTAPGGESVERLRERVLGFLADLGPGSQLIFTHGGVIRLLQALSGSGLTEARRVGCARLAVPGRESAENRSLK